MVFIHDTGGEFRAPIDEVWRFVSSGDHHSAAHRHRKVRRTLFRGNSGRYSWEQDFLGHPERFTMRWTSFYPVGVFYDVLAGPFRGSRFFLYYTPRGRRTEVTIAGEFRSPSLEDKALRSAVARFFAREFRQDRWAIEGDPRAERSRPRE
jgi:hypothetical protein